MALSFIEPDSCAGVDKRIYRCSQAHSVVATVESKGLATYVR